MYKKNIYILSLIFTLFWSSGSFGKGIYLGPERFLEQVFNGNPPEPKKLWIKKNLKTEIKNILGHDMKVLRLRYWDNNTKRAWILEEIGRDKPITVGLITANGKILDVKVLIFRESRGWEVRYPFFTDQFKDATLTTERNLDRKIDGISGATLSVNALTKLARLALFLDSYVDNK